MALLSPQSMAVSGTVITYGAASASDTFVPNDRGVLLYRTAGTASNLTFVVPGNNAYNQAIPDPVVAMGATEARGVWAGGYGAAADATGVVTVTASAITALTVAYVLI